MLLLRSSLQKKCTRLPNSDIPNAWEENQFCGTKIWTGLTKTRNVCKKPKQLWNLICPYFPFSSQYKFSYCVSLPFISLSLFSWQYCLQQCAKKSIPSVNEHNNKVFEVKCMFIMLWFDYSVVQIDLTSV